MILAKLYVVSLDAWGFKQEAPPCVCLNEFKNSLFLVWIVTKESQAPPSGQHLPRALTAHQDAVTSDAPSSDGLHWPGDQGGPGPGEEEVTAEVTSPAFLYPAAASQGQQENGSLYWMRERADTLGNVGRKPLLVSHLDITFLSSPSPKPNVECSKPNPKPIKSELQLGLGLIIKSYALWATTTTPHHPVTCMPVNG